VKVCPEAELRAIEDLATVCDGSFEIGEGLEGLVGERLVENRPQVLGGLKLGGVWGQVDEPDPIWHDQVRCGVPAGVVELKYDEALPSRPGLAGKQPEERGEERLRHPVRHGPEGLARDRLDEGRDVQPLITVVAERNRPLTLGRPDPAQDRLQPDTVLVRGPDLNRLVRGLGCFLGNNRSQLFLNASRSSGVAEAGWRGRGFCTDQPIALSASQPPWGKTSASPSSPAIQRATFGPVHSPHPAAAHVDDP
jgi:hypothetical protein